MVIYRFFFLFRGVLDPGIIVILGYLILLALSESFDNFSIWKIFSASRVPKVVPASENEVKNKYQIEEGCYALERESSELNHNIGLNMIKERDILVKAILKFIETLNINQFSFKTDVKLHGINDDTIDRRYIVYDGYVNTTDEEVFFEVRTRISNCDKSRIEFLLSSLKEYKLRKKSKISLVFIVVIFQGNKSQFDLEIKRLHEFFIKEIESKILNIVEVNFTESEVNKLTSNKK
jgi:hypothetical protein